MTWFKVDDQSTFHPKVVRAGNAAYGAWVRMGAYCNAQLTDGFVPSEISRLIATRSEIEGMVAAGLAHAVDGGLSIHDYLEYQPSREQVTAEREATRERVQRHRNGKRNAVTPPVTNATETCAVQVSRPDPVPIPSGSEEALSRVDARARNGALEPFDFSDTWSRILKRSGMAATHLLVDADRLCRDSARAFGKPVVEHAEALIRAFPLVEVWCRNQGLIPPSVNIAAFVKPEHFARCEDFVKGTLDPNDKPRARGDRGDTSSNPESDSETRRKW